MTADVRSADEFEYLVRARYPLIYVVSSEEKRVEQRVVEVGKARDRRVWAWSITEGFQALDGDERHAELRDPLRALDHIVKQEGNAIFILRDFHPFLQDPSVVRRLRDANKHFRTGQYLRHIVILAPVLKAPMEVEKEMAVLDFDLPGREDIDKIIERLMRSVPSNRTLAIRESDEAREHVIEAALGLTESEVENVFAKSLVRTGEFDIDTILTEKKHIIRKSGLLEFYESDDRFGDVGGLETLKDWLGKRQLAFSTKARDFGLPQPKGILLIGVPGCGKSLTAKAVGALWKMPLLRLDVGKVFSSLVGSSEENFRKAIGTAEAVAPSILWLDELEKGFSGTKSSGQSDAGTTARVFGTFITWLQEKSSPVFVIATANDVSQLPPELLRKGRFDEIFFVDLPSAEERRQIFEIHLRKKKRKPEDFALDELVVASQGFSGSEIEQAIVSALYDAFMDGVDIDTARVVHSAREIIPLSTTMKEGIDAMRDWARSRARTASPLADKSAEGTDAMPALEL